MALADLARSAWNFHAPHDWARSPMPKWVAGAMLLADFYQYGMYYVERESVRRAHRKYSAQRADRVVMLHAAGSLLETLLGFVACLDPAKTRVATATALVALLWSVPTGLTLAPRVWGLPHITVTGYVLVGLLRAYQAGVVLLVDPRTLPDLWILLHMATLVRLVGYHVSPYSSTDGVHGDLLTDPLVYTLTVSIAALITLSFVYPPPGNLPSSPSPGSDPPLTSPSPLPTHRQCSSRPWSPWSLLATSPRHGSASSDFPRHTSQRQSLRTGQRLRNHPKPPAPTSRHVAL